MAGYQNYDQEIKTVETQKFEKEFDIILNKNEEGIFITNTPNWHLGNFDFRVNQDMSTVSTTWTSKLEKNLNGDIVLSFHMNSIDWIAVLTKINIKVADTGSEEILKTQNFGNELMLRNGKKEIVVMKRNELTAVSAPKITVHVTVSGSFSFTYFTYN